MIIRSARVEDALSIAALHAASWRAFYRGALSDEYLDGDILTDRQELWASRLATPAANQLVFLAVSGDEVRGFACVFLDADRKWGALLDNLHVAREHQRQGTGAMLLHTVRDHVRAHRGTELMHLWVLQSNERARAFYESMGGKVVETDRWNPPGGGASAPRFRMAWW